MDTPKAGLGQRSVDADLPPSIQVKDYSPTGAPRSALRNVSNGQPTAIPDAHETPIRGAPRSQRTKTISVGKAGQSGRCQHSKSHGDLSKLRPKSPPLLWLPGETHGFHLSPGNYVDDTQNAFSPTFNRQERRPIPSDWIPKQSSLQWNDGAESVNLPLHGDWQQSSETSVGHQDFGHTNARLPPIVIQGLSPNILQPLDFCVPIVRTYPNDAHGRTRRSSVVEHIDITTTWHGLRYVEAQELYRIHHAFTITIERMLASELWKIYHRQDGTSGTGFDNDLDTSGTLQDISFCRNQLVEEMADSLYSSTNGMVEGQLGFVRLYLAASDCLVLHTDHKPPYRDTSMTVCVYRDHNSHIPYPIVEAVWIPDSVAFKDLNGSPREGQELLIAPQYQRNAAFTSASRLSNVRYSIHSPNTSLSWLRWDDGVAGFRGIVPMYSEMRMYDENIGNATGNNRSYGRPFAPVNRLSIDVMAVLVDDNGGDVRWERVVRTRLNLGILPRSTPNTSYTANPYQSIASDVANRRLHAGLMAHIPLKGPAVGQVYHNVQTHETDSGKHGQLKPMTSAAKPKSNAFGTPDLAQKHADLAARYTDMAQRHSDAETHVRMLGSLPPFDRRGIRQSDLRIFYGGQVASPPLVRNYSGDQGKLSDGSDICCASNDGSRDRKIPSSPRLEPVCQAQPVEGAGSATLQVLPPPAIRSTPSQTFDEDTQTWSRTQTQGTTLGHRYQVSVINEIDKIMANDEENEITRMQGEALRSSPLRQNYQRSPADTSQPSVNEATPISERSGHKRHARSSLSRTSPVKRAKEDSQDDNAVLPVPSTIFHSNYYSPLRDDESSAAFPGPSSPMADYEDEESIQSQTRAMSPHRRTDSGYLSDPTELGSPPELMPADQEESPQGLPAPPPSSRHPLPRSDTRSTLSDDVDNPTSSRHNRHPNLRTISIQSWQSRDTSSRVPSSNIAVTVEDPQARLSRIKQAQLWSQLSDKDDSDKENQPNATTDESRLSDEEKKALENALALSLEEMTGNFDRIFLIDSDSSNSDFGKAEA